MRKAILLAVGFVVVATAASAQSSSRDRGDDDRRGDWREERGWSRDWDHRRDRSMRDEEPGHGASFFLRSGDTQLRVVCDERESTRACVDAALTMFDKVRSQQGSAPGSSAPTSSTPSTPTPTR
jgi:hypothetical protein